MLSAAGSSRIPFTLSDYSQLWRDCMLDLCLVFLVLLLKRAVGEDPSQVWFMATNSWIFCFQLSWYWSFMERRKLSCWSQRNYACIGVFDLCGRLILEGLSCVFQSCDKFVTHFAVLIRSCRLAGPSAWCSLPSLCLFCVTFWTGWLRTCPQVATAPASCNPLPAGPEPCPACECLLVSVLWQSDKSPWRIIVELLSLIFLFLRCLPLRRKFLYHQQLSSWRSLFWGNGCWLWYRLSTDQWPRHERLHAFHAIFVCSLMDWPIFFFNVCTWTLLLVERPP